MKEVLGIMTKEEFEKVTTDNGGFYPPGKSYTFSWAKEQSGVYKEQPYFKPAGIFVTIGDDKFLIQNLKGILEVSLGAKHLYAPGIIRPDAAQNKILREHLEIFLSMMAERGAVKIAEKPEVVKADLEELFALMGVCYPMVSHTEIGLLKKDVQETINDPNHYFSQNQEDFSERGITNALQELYIYVLLDGLIERGIVSEFDCKSEEVKEFTAQCESLGQEVLKWKMDSDSYVLMGVPREESKKMVKLMKKLQIKLSSR